MQLSFASPAAAKAGPSGQCNVVKVERKKKRGFRLNLGIVRINRGGKQTTTTHIECDQ